jgi:hypothetical protein
MTRPSLLPISGMVAVLAMIGSLSGCGSDSESSTPTPTETVTTTVTASATDGPTETPTDDGSTTSGPPATYAEAQARIEAGTPVDRELVRFVTPEGTFCALAVASTAAGCELGDGAVEDTDVCADAPSRFVGRIELQGGAAVPICNTDTIRTEGAPTLPVGSVATTRDTQCLNEGAAVTCVSRTGSGGFYLAPGEYDVF